MILDGCGGNDNGKRDAERPRAGSRLGRGAAKGRCGGERRGDFTDGHRL